MTSGITTAPTKPSGSRTKIRISSQVSFRRPSMGSRLVPDDVPGELEEDVLERREHGAEVANGERVGGDETNHRGDKIVALPLYCVGVAIDAHRRGSHNALQFGREALAIAGEHHGAFRAVLVDEIGGPAHRDDPRALDAP